MRIAADRFVPLRTDWLDLATGYRVGLHIAPAGSRGEQAAWSARCTVLSNLRHPVLNPMLDFGLFDAERTFEAYHLQRPLPAGAAAERCLAHVVRLCEAHGVSFAGPAADVALRAVAAGPAAGVPVGLVLQRRDALDAVRDALAATAPPGPCRVALVGAPGSGLRTAGIVAARLARLAGYVPIAATVAARWPGVLAEVSSRHVCLIEWDDGVAAGAAACLAQLAGAGRRHVLLSLQRDAPAAEAAVTLEPMSVRALTAMVFVDRDHPPSPAAVVEAAHAASGLPGRMLRHLDALREPAGRTGSMLVRETAPAFGSGAPASDDEPSRRTARAMLAAERRADRLTARGRHAQAERALRRAFKVLEARGFQRQAADCALTLGRLVLDRGRVGDALGWIDRARALEPDGVPGVRATLALGDACTWAARLIEAEAAFRTASLAAPAMGEALLSQQAALGLAECLCLQGRVDEAAALPAFRQKPGPPAQGTHLSLGRTIIAIGSGDVTGAVRAARDAMCGAAALRDARLLARAHRQMGVALAAAGDEQQAAACLAEGIAHARAARLPIDALRMRCVLMTVSGARVPAGSASALRLAEHGVPRLVQIEIRVACARAAGEGPDAETRRWIDEHGIRGPIGAEAVEGPVAVLERFLDRCRTAPDDRAAVEQALTDVATRLRASTLLVVGAPPGSRVLAHWGRPWPGEPLAAHRVLAAGAGLPPDPAAEPCTAAEPLRFGGEVIAALAGRWAPGTAVDPARASALLRMAALAISANVRSMLDRTLVEGDARAAGDLLGDSEAARTLRDGVSRAARAPFPVLIEGESGTGKELVARAIHRLSARRDRRFCPVNCAALTDDLLEAELFGHARGAFTGAVGERGGLFEEADGGTIFLDEVGELSARAQAKLLRVLQDGEVRRVGENHARRVDVRVVAATNRRLADEAASGRFRADLRFRLDVVRIDVPPLRERAGDITLLAAHFWADATTRVGSRATLSPEALSALSRYDWPGNVRELQNVVAWIAVHSPHRSRVAVSGLPAHIAQAGRGASSTFEAAREEFERRFVRAALATASGHRTAAAEALGMSRQGLAKMMKRLGIE